VGDEVAHRARLGNLMVNLAGVRVSVFELVVGIGPKAC